MPVIPYLPPDMMRQLASRPQDNSVVWGRSQLMTPQFLGTTDPALLDYQTLIEVAQEKEWTPGFNVSVRVPRNLETDEYVGIYIDYGGGGIAASSRLFQVGYPISFAVPGNSIRVRCALITTGFPPVGVPKDVGAFATPFPRDFQYPLAVASVITFGPPDLAPGAASPVVQLSGRSARGMLFSALDAAGGPCAVQVRFYIDLATIGAMTPIADSIGLPYPIPSNAIRFDVLNCGAAACHNFFYTVIEEL